MLAEPREFVGSESPCTPFCFADQPQLAAGSPGLCDDFGVHGRLPDALGGPQDDADPDQVIDHGGGPGTSRTTRLNMTYQIGGRQGVCNRLAERMSL